MIEARTPTTAQNLLLRTPPAQADDPIQTAAGTLNKFFFEYKLNRGKLMAGQLEITEATSCRLSTTSATDSGRQGDQASCRPTRTTAEGSPAKAMEAYFFLCFTMRTGGPQKDFSIVSSMTPSNGGNGLQHRYIGQLRRPACNRGEGTRRPGTGAPPKRS